MATVAAVKISVPGDSVDPTSAWDRRKVKQKVKTVKPQSHKEKKKEGHTRFVCISGTVFVLITAPKQLIQIWKWSIFGTKKESVGS